MPRHNSVCCSLAVAMCGGLAVAVCAVAAGMWRRLCCSAVAYTIRSACMQLYAWQHLVWKIKHGCVHAQIICKLQVQRRLQRHFKPVCCIYIICSRMERRGEVVGVWPYMWSCKYALVCRAWECISRYVW